MSEWRDGATHRFYVKGQQRLAGLVWSLGECCTAGGGDSGPGQAGLAVSLEKCWSWVGLISGLESLGRAGLEVGLISGPGWTGG